MKHHIQNKLRALNYSISNHQYYKCPDKIPTFNLAEDEGKVTRNSISSAEGGSKRSPFLTAPFTNIDLAFGAAKILQPNRILKKLESSKQRRGVWVKERRITRPTYFSTDCKIISLDCGLELLPLTIGRRL
jgi:hypothetical protein